MGKLRGVHSSFSCTTNKREKIEGTIQKDFFLQLMFVEQPELWDHKNTTAPGGLLIMWQQVKIPILKTDSLEVFWLLMKSPKDPSVSWYTHAIILGKIIWFELGVVDLTHKEDNFLTNEFKFQFKIKLPLQNVQSKETWRLNMSSPATPSSSSSSLPVAFCRQI